MLSEPISLALGMGKWREIVSGKAGDKSKALQRKVFKKKQPKKTTKARTHTEETTTP